MLVPDALYACPYKIHSSQIVKYDRNRTRSFFCFVFFFRFSCLRQDVPFMAKVSFDCFAFICLFIRSVRNRKGRERKVSYLVHIR